VTARSLVVSVRDAAAANEALAAFDAEARRSAAAPAPDLGQARSGWRSRLCCWPSSRWQGRGSSAAIGVVPGEHRQPRLILRGQWWRAVTALTLHADVMHLASGIAGLLLASAVGRWLGPGLGAR
jgi:hypothetical protein